MKEETNTVSAPRKRRPLWRRVLKYTAVTVGSLIALLLIAITVALWYLTPDRLTPIVNDIASEALMADVRASRVELTFWSTFPHLKVRVDSLSVVSRRFDSIPAVQKALLPRNPDSLLTLQSLQGSVNVATLAAGNIDLSDVDIVRPSLNLVVLDDSLSNFDIFPSSEPSETSGIPSVSINSFVIRGDMPVRFRSVSSAASLADVDATVTLRSLALDGTGTPTYRIEVDGSAIGGFDPMMFPSVPIGLDGNVRWDSATPMAVGITDFTLRAGAVNLMLDTEIDFTDAVVVRRLMLRLRDLDVAAAVAMLPPSLRGPLGGLQSDMTVNASVRVDSAFAPLDLQLPVAQVDVDAACTYLNLGKIRLHRILLQASATADLAAPDRSIARITRFAMQGPAMDFTVSGQLLHPLSDPKVKGRFTGHLDFSRLPRPLLDRLPFTITGNLRGEADINTSLSYLTREGFHKMRVDGELSLSDFRMAMRDSTAEAYMHHGEFHLGTRSTVKIKDYNVDSMLTASLAIDTLAFRAPGVDLQARNFKAGAGSKNIASSADTTVINPIGAQITADRIRLISEADSMRVILREARVGASLTRYHGETRSPMLRLGIDARRIRYADALNRFSLSRSNIALTLHPKPRRPMSASMKVRYDSIASLHPELTADSILSLARADARRHRRSSPLVGNGRENIEFASDSTLRQWLRRWQASGHITARRARLFTPYFPTRNVLSDLDLTFSTDSVTLRDTRLRTGRSDFLLNGSVRNISRAFTSQRRKVPLELDFSIDSDTLDLNDLSATAIRGAAFTHRTDPETILLGDIESETDDFLQQSVETQTEDLAQAAIVVPSNITASLRLNAARVRYNDIWLRDMRGLVSVFDGAVNLEEFKGVTDVGSVSMTALYSAPSRKEISFAAGMRIKRLNLHEFIHLIPQVDSLMPMLSYMEGIVDADAALTTKVDSLMNIDLATTNMALKLSGDSLVLLDSETFRTVSKWMLFKNKKRNMIDHMDVEIAVRDGYLDLYPFIFDMDRYRLGVKGSNDAALNLDYHVSVLKSPIPFKFGINIKGTPEKLKIRLGGAKVNEKSVASSRQITDTVRINLIREIRNVFRRGVRTAGAKGLKLQGRHAMQRDSIAESADTISHADSLEFIRRGLIEAPKPDSIPLSKDKAKNRSKKKKK